MLNPIHANPARLFLSKLGSLQEVWEGRLASYFANQIRTHPDEVYGGGFKAALDALQQHGLRTTLLYVKKTGVLPPDNDFQADVGLTAKQQVQAGLQSQKKKHQQVKH